MKLVSRTLSDQAFEVIRERILSSRIPPMTPIRQDALAEELGISKIPLREALARLEHDGLLSTNANRGYFVPALTTTEAEEVFALRLKIEPDAAAAACLDADEAERDVAKAALKSLEASSDADAQGTVSFNCAFHLVLVQPGGRQVTAQLVQRLHVLGERYVRKHLELGSRARVDGEHRAILKAWLARDAARVGALVSEHIAKTQDDLRLQLHQGIQPRDSSLARPRSGRGNVGAAAKSITSRRGGAS